MENGPVIVTVEVEYKGDKEIAVRRFPDNRIRVRRFPGGSIREVDMIVISRIDGWTFKETLDQYMPLQPDILNRDPVVVVEGGEIIKPGRKYSQCYFLHHQYEAKLETEQEIVVEKARSSKITQIHDEMEKVFTEMDPKSAKYTYQVNRMLWSNHSRLAPLALKVLERSPHHRSDDLRRFLMTWCRDSADLRVELIDYLHKQGTKHDSFFLIRMYGLGMKLNRDELIKLITANNLWIRAYAYRLENEDNRLPEELQVDSLRRELQELQEHLNRPRPPPPPP
jgi:hypothetical protein